MIKIQLSNKLQGFIDFTGIMQPYFLPYIGYFQLIEKCNNFVIYDDCQFTKKGWINRNILRDKQDWKISIPLVKSPTESIISDKRISSIFDQEKIIRKIDLSYKKAPFFYENRDLVFEILRYNSSNLFDYLLNSIKSLKDYFEIDTKIHVSSDLVSTTNLKGKEKIFALCREIQATNYLNPISGHHLYSQEEFQNNNLKLFFFRPLVKLQNYSIIDDLFYNGKKNVVDEIRRGEIINVLNLGGNKQTTPHTIDSIEG